MGDHAEKRMVKGWRNNEGGLELGERKKFVETVVCLNRGCQAPIKLLFAGDKTTQQGGAGRPSGGGVKTKTKKKKKKKKKKNNGEKVHDRSTPWGSHLLFSRKKRKLYWSRVFSIGTKKKNSLGPRPTCAQK